MKFPLLALSLIFLLAQCGGNSSLEDSSVESDAPALENMMPTDGSFKSELESLEDFEDPQFNFGNQVVTRIKEGAVQSVKAYDVDAGNTSSETPASDQESQNTSEKIIRTAYLGMELKNYDRDKHELFDEIKKYGGFVSSENEERETYRINNSLIIKIDNTQFEKLLTALSGVSGISQINYRRTNAVDVSEEYFDLLTRIKTKKKVEERYLDILRQAKTIQDILSVEGQIRQIREEIESKQGRLNFLADRVSKSTIHLNMYQNLEKDNPVIDKPGFLNKIAKAFYNGWNGILKLVVVIINIWPLWVIITLLILFLRRRKFFRSGK